MRQQFFFAKVTYIVEQREYIRGKICGTFNIVSIFPLFPNECRNRFKHPDEITGSEGSMYLITSTAVFQSCNLAAKQKFSREKNRIKNTATVEKCHAVKCGYTTKSICAKDIHPIVSCPFFKLNSLIFVVKYQKHQMS